jgi:choline dehydrogenase-like flavoprotein
MIPTPQTPFTRDILGNFVCNTFVEAQGSGPFDVVIIGGGTFGLTLAQDLLARTQQVGLDAIAEDAKWRPAGFRILVLEAGPFALPEHTQDIPNLQLNPPGLQPNPPASALPATRSELIAQKLDATPILENWGLPWDSNERFGGLAYCLGGRSLYFGGWSPRYLPSEMHRTSVGAIGADMLWPAAVVEDLTLEATINDGFQRAAAMQTGVSTANDFIDGTLHGFLRQTLSAGYPSIPSAIPLAEMPDYVREVPQDVTAGLAQQLNAAGPPGSPARAAFQLSLALDAPLTVQAVTRPGFFPFNKFSSVPLGITAARQAFAEAGTNNAAKRLMIVPNCHVKRLLTRPYVLATGATVQEVIGIDTASGPLDLSGTIANNVNRRPVVVLAAGAIESARLGMVSVSGIPNGNLMGTNLMVHLRKNVPFTITPLPALPSPLTDQELSALLVRCRANLADGTPAHFHLQITASAVPPGPPAKNRAEALLFQNVPDLDHVRYFTTTAPGQLDVIIRAVGEMLPNPQSNNVTLTQPPDNDEYGVPRAWVNIVRGPRDVELMKLMDAAIDATAKVLGLAAPLSAAVSPDGLGTTYHESGTLRMGEDPALSVTNPDGQFHYVTNLYAGDASVLPTCGSANPVMNGIALRRRLARRLTPEGDGAGDPSKGLVRPVAPFFRPAVPAAPPVQLFDGRSLANWRMAGRGTFHVIDGALQSVPSFDLGLLWCTIPMPQNYRLELEFFIRTFQTNSGVLVRFRNPQAAGYYNPAWAASFVPGFPSTPNGFEVQIDNTGAPDGRPKHHTGAIYAVNYPSDGPDDPALPPAQPGDFVNPQNALVMGWNSFRIDVQGDVFTVSLNGTPTAKYTNTDPNRGRFLAAEQTFVGLQSYSNYSDTTAFRNIRVTVL